MSISAPGSRAHGAHARWLAALQVVVIDTGRRPSAIDPMPLIPSTTTPASTGAAGLPQGVSTAAGGPAPLGRLTAIAQQPLFEGALDPRGNAQRLLALHAVSPDDAEATAPVKLALVQTRGVALVQTWPVSDDGTPDPGPLVRAVRAHLLEDGVVQAAVANVFPALPSQVIEWTQRRCAHAAHTLQGVQLLRDWQKKSPAMDCAAVAAAAEHLVREWGSTWASLGARSKDPLDRWSVCDEVAQRLGVADLPLAMQGLQEAAAIGPASNALVVQRHEQQHEKVAEPDVFQAQIQALDLAQAFGLPADSTAYVRLGTRLALLGLPAAVAAQREEIRNGEAIRSGSASALWSRLVAWQRAGSLLSELGGQLAAYWSALAAPGATAREIKPITHWLGDMHDVHTEIVALLDEAPKAVEAIRAGVYDVGQHVLLNEEGARGAMSKEVLWLLALHRSGPAHLRKGGSAEAFARQAGMRKNAIARPVLDLMAARYRLEVMGAPLDPFSVKSAVGFNALAMLQARREDIAWGVQVMGSHWRDTLGLQMDEAGNVQPITMPSHMERSLASGTGAQGV